MYETAADIDRRMAERLKAEREALGLTLEQLAERSLVSRAMISRIERRQSSPTAALLGRLCGGLEITLSSLLAGIDGAASEVLRAGDQPTWRDPKTGLRRRAMSPSGRGSPVEIIHGTLPPRARIDYPPMSGPIADQHIVGLEGTVQFGGGDVAHDVGPGDCLHCALDRPHFFANPGTEPCVYLVVLVKRRGEQ